MIDTSIDASIITIDITTDIILIMMDISTDASIFIIEALFVINKQQAIIG
jgi:hypothetical protein